VDEDDIVGLWSVEAGYHTAMDDEVLVFFPDGAGIVEFARPYISECVDFRWSRVRPGVVLLEPSRRTYLEGDEILEDDVPAAEEVEYSIELEDRPLLADPIPVLYLPVSFVVYHDQGHGLLDRTPPERWRDPRWRGGV
jgi:hypothetical protein